MPVTVRRRKTLALGILLLLCVGAGVASPDARAAGIDARVTGPFTMGARVTKAVNVRGEHVGQRLTRKWVIVPRQCLGSICQTLELDRQRSANQHTRITLHRTGPGDYSGTGVFYVALSCFGRVHRYGGRAPYKITLKVVAATEIGGVMFAQRISASYVNRSRTDATRCPLGPSHDAAEYTGRLKSRLPTAPVARFSVSVDVANDVATFTDLSHRTRRGARLVSQLWNFDDRASGTLDTSTLANPTHQFSAPGDYVVTLTETNLSGLQSTKTETVVAPGPPSAAFQYTQSGDQVSFQNGSKPGIGDAPVVAWYWNFGDSSSGSADTSTLENPVHDFSGPGSYVVTLLVVDANHRGAEASETITVPPS